MKMTAVIAKQHYFPPGGDNRIEIKKFLRYLTRRDGAQQWVDRGMGSDPAAILQCSDQMNSRFTQLRDIALPPDPYLWPHIPADRRHAVMSRVVERSMSKWGRDNQWGTLDYSYILHEKEEDESEKLHAHIVLPGTIQPDPVLSRRHHRIRSPHLEDLRRTASAFFIKELEREVGPERLAQILKERDERIELDRAAKRELESKHRAAPDQGMGDIAGVVGLIKEQGRIKEQKKRNIQASKKAQRRADARRFRIYMKEQAKQQRAETRRQAREERLAAREQNHQEQLAELRREEEERSPNSGGFSHKGDIDFDM